MNSVIKELVHVESKLTGIDDNWLSQSLQIHDIYWCTVSSLIMSNVMYAIF